MNTSLILTVHKQTCNILNVDYEESLNKCRCRDLVEARQLTMTVIRDIYKSDIPLRVLSGAFGQNHATVKHSEKTIHNLIEYNDKMFDAYNKMVTYTLHIKKTNETRRQNGYRRMNKDSFIIELKKELMQTKDASNLKMNIRQLIRSYESL